jgi:hypothetical protein
MSATAYLQTPEPGTPNPDTYFLPEADRNCPASCRRRRWPGRRALATVLCRCRIRPRRVDLGPQVEEPQQRLSDRVENDPTQMDERDRTQVAHCACPAVTARLDRRARRQTSGSHWLKPGSRCLVPANSFSEYAPEANPVIGKDQAVWQSKTRASKDKLRRFV